MQRAFEILVKSLAALVVVIIAFFVMNALGSNWRVASDDRNSIELLSVLTEGDDEIREIPFIGPELADLLRPKVVRVETLGAVDALINAFSLFVSAFTLTLLILGFAAAFVGCTVGGVVTADWGLFLAGPLCLLGIVLVPVLVAVGTFVVWCELLIEPCTPAYALIWVLVGLPFGVIGVTAGSVFCAGTATMVVSAGLVPGTWVMRSGG